MHGGDHGLRPARVIHLRPLPVTVVRDQVTAALDRPALARLLGIGEMLGLGITTDRPRGERDFEGIPMPKELF